MHQINFFVILISSSVDRLYLMRSHIWSKYTPLNQFLNTIQGCEICNTKPSLVCQACLHRHCLCSVRDWTSYLLRLQADRTKVTPTSILPSPFICQYTRYPYDFTVGTVVFLIFNLFGSLLSAPLTRSDEVCREPLGDVQDNSICDLVRQSMTFWFQPLQSITELS